MTRKRHRKRDLECRLDALESENDPELGEMTKEELTDAWRAAIDPDRPNPGDGSDAYIELLERKYEDNDNNNDE